MSESLLCFYSVGLCRVWPFPSITVTAAHVSVWRRPCTPGAPAWRSSAMTCWQTNRGSGRLNADETAVSRFSRRLIKVPRSRVRDECVTRYYPRIDDARTRRNTNKEFAQGCLLCCLKLVNKIIKKQNKTNDKYHLQVEIATRGSFTAPHPAADRINTQHSEALLE